MNNSEKNILCVIPVRLESTRFPGKPFAKILGKPMINWICERVKASGFSYTVATDSDKIHEHVLSFGGQSVLTFKKHENGTERVFEAYKTFSQSSGKDFEVVVNIQGDEPLILPENIKLLAKEYNPQTDEILTLVTPKIFDREILFDSHGTFAVRDQQDRALYFSRLAIPFQVDRGFPQTKLRHLGIYAYSPKVLEEISSLPVSFLEKSESLEQNRWLEYGKKIRLIAIDHNVPAVDKAEHISEVENFIRENPEYGFGEIGNEGR